MDLVQWVVGRKDGQIHTAIAPRDAERIPILERGKSSVGEAWATGSSLLLQSAALPLNLLWAQHEAETLEGGESGELELATEEHIAEQTLWHLKVVLAAEGAKAGDSPLFEHSEGLRAMGLMTELATAAASLLEAVALQPLSLSPDGRAGGLSMVVAPSSHQSDAELGGALVLVRAGMELLVHARGLSLIDAQVVLADGVSLNWDGSSAHRLIEKKAD